MASTHEVRLHGEEIDFGNADRPRRKLARAPNGFNMIARPEPGRRNSSCWSNPMPRPWSINKVPATTPNRGLTVIENIPTLQYSTTISELLNGSPDARRSAASGKCRTPTLNDGFDMFRIASVPHGNAVEAMGTSSVTARPARHRHHAERPADRRSARICRGYTDAYLVSLQISRFQPRIPQPDPGRLSGESGERRPEGDAARSSCRSARRTRAGSTTSPRSRTNAIPTQFDATFWLETLQDDNGNIFQPAAIFAAHPDRVPDQNATARPDHHLAAHQREHAQPGQLGGLALPRAALTRRRRQRDVEPLDLADAAALEPALDQLGAGQAEDAAVGEDRPRIAVPVDAGDLALIAGDAVLVRPGAVVIFVDIVERCTSAPIRLETPPPDRPAGS